MKSITDSPSRDWERQNDQGHYQCRTERTLQLCRQAIDSTAKSKSRQLLESNIALLEEHRSLESNSRIRNRAERVIDYLEARKDNPDLVFNSQLPVRFR